MQIVIVEDDPITVILLKGMLKKLGHEVCAVFDTGEELIEKIQDIKPSAILMDIHLRGAINGIVVTKQLLELRKVPVIFTSGDQDEKIVSDAAKSGAVGFIQKPVDIKALKINLDFAVRFYTLHKRIRQSEALHRSIFDKASVGIYLASTKGYYLNSNLAFATMFGYDNPRELLNNVKSIDEQVYDQEGKRQELIHALEQNGFVNDFESEVYGRDGDKFWISENCTAEIDEAGNVVQYEAVVLNISDKKEAEQATQMTLNLLQNTIDSISDLVVVQDMDENIILSNKATAQLAETHHCLIEQLKTQPALAGDITPFQQLVKNSTECSGHVHIEGINGVVWLSKATPYRMPDETIIGVVQILHKI